MNPKSTRQHPKNQATSMIWGCAVGMFALCIPLTEVAGSGPILPTLVIEGAIMGTAAVWFTPGKHRKEEMLAIKALEDRIIDIEAICTSLPEANKMSQFSGKEKH